jgi:hypothetical protein
MEARFTPERWFDSILVFLLGTATIEVAVRSSIGAGRSRLVDHPALKGEEALRAFLDKQND